MHIHPLDIRNQSRLFQVPTCPRLQIRMIFFQILQTLHQGIRAMKEKQCPLIRIQKLSSSTSKENKGIEDSNLLISKISILCLRMKQCKSGLKLNQFSKSMMDSINSCHQNFTSETRLTDRLKTWRSVSKEIKVHFCLHRLTDLHKPSINQSLHRRQLPNKTQFDDNSNEDTLQLYKHESVISMGQ